MYKHKCTKCGYEKTFNYKLIGDFWIPCPNCNGKLEFIEEVDRK